MQRANRALRRILGGVARARGRAGLEPPDTAPDTLRERLLAAMEEPGCPLCGLVREQERRYFFWFFAENYHAPETLASLVASHGFCQHHAGRLAVRHADKASAIAVVYELVSRKVSAELAAEAARERPTWPSHDLGRCPACASRERSERRFLGALADLLSDSRERARYRSPHLLCQSHLQQLEPLLPVAELRHVLQVHLAWLEAAVRRSAAGLEGESRGAVEGADPASDAGGDPGGAASLGSLVRDVDPPEAAAPLRGDRDPLDVEGAVGRALDDAERCPVCAAGTDALHAWRAYCDAHISDGEPVDDLLPTCDAHVSAFLADGGPELRDATLRQLAGRVRDTLARTLAALQEDRSGSWRERSARLLSGAREPPEERARRTFRRAIPCPVCSMLATTDVRALALLDVLLRAGPAAARYARGHGICLRHLRAATPGSAAPGEARALLRHARADVELLAWRLRETGRLDGWNLRPLTVVADETTWRRALYRYVGEPM